MKELHQTEPLNFSDGTNEHAHLYKELLDISKAMDEAVIVAITNAQGVITYINDMFLEISKYSREELLGNTHRILNSGYHPPSFFKEMWETIKSGKIWNGEIKNRAKDGSTYWVRTTIVPFLNKEGKPYKYIAIRTDITDRIRMEKELQEALENDFQRTIKQLANLIFKIRLDANGNLRFMLAEGKLAERLNFNTKKVQNKTIYELFSVEQARTMEQYILEAYAGKHVSFEINVQNIYFYVHLSPIMKGTKVKEVVGTAVDITARKKAENKVKYMAYHDPLTDLPNRLHFIEKLEYSIRHCQKKNKQFAVLFLDLDRFKNINDTLGHTVGDELLKSVSKRLICSVRNKDVVSRFGGDEFSILLPETDAQEAATCAKRILEEFEEFFSVGNIDIYISPSIGISTFPQDGQDSETLIKHADIAMYHAKAQGKNNYQFFNTELVERNNKKMLLEIELRRAVENNQLLLYYQPQIDVTLNKVVGVEALIRWHHPKLGIIPPADFIPLAEETGLIIPIGEWILRAACEQNKAWQNAGYPPLTMAVNISIRQFMSQGFPNMVQQVLAETKLDPKYLELEITESMTSDIQYTEQVLCKLQKIGVKVSIDDFGTGYSSLSYLSKLPINKLKIDQAFLNEFDSKNKAVVRAVIALAQNLELEVLAEGVEADSHVEYLKSQGCKLVQGYHFFKPMEPNKIETLFK